VRGETNIGGMPAILPTVEGRAWIRGSTSTWSIPPTRGPMAIDCQTLGALAIQQLNSRQTVLLQASRSGRKRTWLDGTSFTTPATLRQRTKSDHRAG